MFHKVVLRPGVKLSRNGVPQPVSDIPPPEIAVSPPKVVVPPSGDADAIPLEWLCLDGTHCIFGQLIS